MRIIPTAICQPGMRLGKAIFTEEGQVLVGYRVELTAGMLRKLSQLGIDYLYIEDPRTEDIHIEDPIHEETRRLLRGSLGRVFEKFGATSGLSGMQRSSSNSMGKLFLEGMSRVIDDLQQHRHEAVMLTTLNMVPAANLEQHFCQNALNVCVYATRLAIMQGTYSRDELMTIGLGALLHDVGSVQIPAQLLQKNAKLTPNEFAEIQKHAEYGFMMLKDEIGIPLLSAQCALQHHERMDGSGYPFRLKGDQIHPYARWVGLFDSYDAMIHSRTYRQALAPHTALEVLYANAGKLYDIDMVKLFRNNVAIYPLGLSVSLSTGEKGIVSRLNNHSMQRPIVRVLRDAGGLELKEPYEIDLSRTLNIMVEEIGEQLVV
ncbi:HD-GYP domain-containing protein [Paenibacillus athensensis]|uniref:HD-GYP domain-containing protein n=1 Tax=Paenibacillus athensensis TaxID=1967502 RepID=A0A4Y8Q2R3_9BACL|nr:HD-GYP domain-containing protein [Paenibacillus athensensis]MCD1258726.1 HD-GYP domain-containing protein [Paenibacillus athensensis]